MPKKRPESPKEDSTQEPAGLEGSKKESGFPEDCRVARTAEINPRMSPVLCQPPLLAGTTGQTGLFDWNANFAILDARRPRENAAMRFSSREGW